MTPTLDDHPFWYVYGFYLVVVFFRAQATYWVGRGAASGALRLGKDAPQTSSRQRLNNVLTGPRMAKARATIDKWGAPAVTVSFLTVGFQTVVNAAAGFMRMNYLRYTIAMVAGSMAWAAIYSIGTLALIRALEALGLTLMWAFVAAAVIAAVAGLVLLVVHRRRGVRGAADTKVSTAPGAEAAEHAPSSDDES